MELGRTSGVLLHPTSLPGSFGVGDLGAEAREFVDCLVAAKQHWWQILPLNPTDGSGSPYASYSAFAGNPMLIDLRPLVEKGWLQDDDLVALQDFADSEADDRANIAALTPLKMKVLGLAHANHDAAPQVAAYRKQHKGWIEDVALFSALKSHFGDRSWKDWDAALVAREPKAIAAAKKNHAKAMDFVVFCQWLFDSQWFDLRAYANERGVKIIGDLPIFVAMDSADVWSERSWFQVGPLGEADEVAGVPPDYFSETGQKWGNPLYDWAALKKDDFGWWIRRIQRAMAQCDLVRIDHFRGFESFWAVPEAAPNAIQGEWRKGPSDSFFVAIKKALGEVPFIAEDLGIITPEVSALRDRQELPGMKILQFAFDGSPDHAFLPHTYPTRCVAYTGTHDNDTSLGWYESLREEEKHLVRTYLSHGDEGIVWAMIESVAASKAELVVFPLQDILELDAESRMNIPGTSTGNWGWRVSAAQLKNAKAFRHLGQITEKVGRS
jgi:4-alpha-glucanotransferase